MTATSTVYPAASPAGSPVHLGPNPVHQAASPVHQAASRAHEVVGRDERIPLLDGRLVRYVNLDNAASTPAFRGVLDTVQRFLPYASSVHRGSGYKSRISTAAFEDGRPASAGSWVPTPSVTSSCSRRTRPKRSTSSPDRSRWTTTRSS